MVMRYWRVEDKCLPHSPPMRGSFHVEAVEVNTPIACAGIQVLPGGLVLADVSGIAFIPIGHVETILDGVLG